MLRFYATHVIRKPNTEQMQRLYGAAFTETQWNHQIMSCLCVKHHSETCSAYIYLIKSQPFRFDNRTKPYCDFVFFPPLVVQPCFPPSTYIHQYAVFSSILSKTTETLSGFTSYQLSVSDDSPLIYIWRFTARFPNQLIRASKHSLFSECLWWVDDRPVIAGTRCFPPSSHRTFRKCLKAEVKSYKDHTNWNEVLWKEETEEET